MSSLRESSEFKRGRNGEQIVSFILRGLGYYIIPSYDFTGRDDNKAPRMLGSRLAFVIPDLDVARGGKRHWVEVKTKAKADFTRKTQREEHGIDKRHYEHYQRVEAETGCEVVIAVYEEISCEVLAITLRRIAKEVRFSANFNAGRGGYFWSRDSMQLLATVRLLNDVYEISVPLKFKPEQIGDWKPIGQVAAQIFEGLRMRLRFEDAA